MVTTPEEQKPPSPFDNAVERAQEIAGLIVTGDRMGNVRGRVLWIIALLSLLATMYQPAAAIVGAVALGFMRVDD